jgi:hypothetical protein
VGEILNSLNLLSYTSGQYRRRLPNWPLPDLLYSKIPVLAYRNYVNDCAENKWPAC